VNPRAARRFRGGTGGGTEAAFGPPREAIDLDPGSGREATMDEADRAKRAAAERAVALVAPGMRLGLGSGSTAAWFVRLLAERRLADLTCVATSSATAALAAELGLTVRELDEVGRLDLAVDGADEVDPARRLIKGGGGALLREKIVATASDRFVVIADAGKRVATLGAFPLPVEVVRFGVAATARGIERALAGADVDGRTARLRLDGETAFVTDEGHHILDLHLRRIGEPSALAAALSGVPGVVEHGLFLGMAERVILGRADGSTSELAPPGEPGAEPGLTPEEARIWAEELTRAVEQ
jgi:ribose 5-phosphate isomerase A